MEITARMQVVHRQKLPGTTNKQIRIGEVTKAPKNGLAEVFFASDNVRRTIPLSELTPTSSEFGRATVNHNPIRRAISKNNR